MRFAPWIAAAVVAGVLAGPMASAAERPNVVLMMADDMGWGDPQCFNEDSPIATPHLDAMAAAGLKFNRFYSAAPVCSPTRGSCLTGRHPYRYGVYFANTGHLKEAEITLPELLKKEGYTTGHFGKWHLGTLTTEIKDANRGGPRNREHFSTPTMNGYDVCLVTESKVPTYDPLVKPPNAPGTAWDFLTASDEKVPYGTHYWNEQGESVTEGITGDDSRIIMDRAVAFIEDAVRREQPFLAVVWFHAPHLPVVAGPEHVAHYADEDVFARNYYGCITALDEQVGRLRAQLRSMGVAEETILWYCSDNGPEGAPGSNPGSAGPFRGRKRSLYEGGVRVPGIVEWPGRIKPGSETDFPAVTSDYLPTILDLLDVDYPDDRPLDGVSFVGIWEEGQSTRNRPIGFQSRNQRSWSDDRYKLYTGDKGKTWELYDLVTDPSESANVINDHPDVAHAMQQQLEAWINSCQASDAGTDY